MGLSAKTIQDYLSGIEPFLSLPAQELGCITAAAKAKNFSKGETLYSEGERADGVWVLYRGRVQVFKSISGGRSFAVETLAPGELFGTLCRLGSRSRFYPCTAVASEPTTVVWILECVFMEYYLKSPGFARGLCFLCSERLEDVQGLRCLGQEAVPVRVAATLSRLYQVHGRTIPFTKKEISELIAAALETTFRALSEFEKKGILSSSRGKIVIKDPKALRSLLSRA
ncbi:MAG: Crp/Fnr family transcriptional regulator [Elusimicrobia bacterium]|nr:Crp/Fnr family transcriptional regulator [Elusimicrobiota bacterium]